MRLRTAGALALLAAGTALALAGDRFGSNRVLAAVAAVTTVGVLLVAVTYAVDRRVTDPDRWRPEVVESGHRVPVPRADGHDDGAVGLLDVVRGRAGGGEADGGPGGAGGPDRSTDSRRDTRGRDVRSPDDPGSAVRTHVTTRWTGVGAVALAFAGLGVFVRTPGLVLAGAVGVAFVGYSRLSRPLAAADTGAVSVERAVDAASPAPGESVAVTVTVRNETGRVLGDVRVVDGVPPALPVTGGSPRQGAVLGPGDETAFTYAVTARRGEHEWDPAAVVVADPAAAAERVLRVGPTTTVRCRPPALDTDRLPLRGAGTQYAGQVETDEGGPGIEFHSTREYRPGDPLSRIDWHRRAETGEFATLSFREERAAKVMLLVDSRRAAYRAPARDGSHAVQRSVEAAGRTFTALLDTGDRVGIAALGRALGDCWLPPRAGDDHRAAGRELLTTHPALSPVPPARDLYEDYRADRRETLEHRLVGRIHRRLSPNAQVLFFAPCCDDYPVTVARRLDAYGHPVTVVSPDPTAADTPARRRARDARRDRLATLRGTGVRVLDWRADEPFEAALARAEERWSG